MRVITHLGVLFLTVAAMTMEVCAQGIRQSGIVFDEQSGNKIAGASVSAGGQALRDEVTDGTGLFILHLTDGMKIGETIRIRVQKIGYKPYDEQVAVSVEIPLRVPLQPLKKASPKATAPVVKSAPIVVSPVSPPSRDNVREQGLTLSKEILDFLAERERNDPHTEQAPREHGASAGGAINRVNMTPKYMQETLVLFGGKFESRIADIHDEFASRGLHDSTLDALYKDPAHNMFGNIDAAITRIAESIRTLALLAPPSGLYKDVSDAKLAQIAIEEANKMDEMTSHAMGELSPRYPPPVPPDAEAIRFFFMSTFRDCCLNQVQYLRSELMKRLGPSAYDTDEMRAFNGSNGFTEIENNPSASIATVLEYSPHFRRLAIKLKRKATPPSGPKALTYFENQVASEKPTIHYKLVVTIETKTTLGSGYVFVQFAGKYTVVSLGSDFADATLVTSGRDVLENPELAKLLEWSPDMPSYAFKIGKTPFTSSNPIHVIVEGHEQVHVAKALFFDE
jgi:hypothetical protein